MEGPNRESKSMPCALCKADAPLKNSHIIPEFLYRSLYDDKHRFHQISIEPERVNLYLQKGLREPLLCGQCEQRVSVWERHMSLVLAGGIGIGVRRVDNRLFLSQLDYKTLKLFQLSILWRASVSTLPAFAQVILGPHEERIRIRLLNEDPGITSSYGCITFILMHQDELLQGMIVAPTWARLLEQKAYRFVFGGLVFVYIVSSSKTSNVVSKHFLQQNGTAIVKLQQIHELRFLVDTVAKMHRLG